MERIKNKVWEELIGFQPNREMKEMILAEVAATGKSLQQVIGEGKTVPIMPEMGILGEDGKFEYRGKRMTSKEFEEVNPLASFAKIVILGTQEQVEKHRRLCNES